MTDVVERLKAYSGQRTRDFCALGATGKMLWDAIDEIERLRRLRAALKQISDMKYEDRYTVTPEMAWEEWQKLNQKLCAIYDLADKAGRADQQIGDSNGAT